MSARTMETNVSAEMVQQFRRSRAAWFWDRPVAIKIGTSLALLGVVFGLVGGVGAIALLRAGQNLETVRTLTGELQGSMAKLRAVQTQSHLLVQRATEATDASTREQLLMSAQWNDRTAARMIEQVSSYPESKTQQIGRAHV